MEDRDGSGTPKRGVPLLDEAAGERVAAACQASFPSCGPWRAEVEVHAAASAAAARLASRLDAAFREEFLLADASVSFDGDALCIESRAKGKVVSQRCEDFRSLARFCCNLCPGTEDNCSAVEIELQQAFEQETLGLAYHQQVWTRRYGSITSLWGFVNDEQREWQLEDRLLFWEQLAAFKGHPWHPLAKLRLPMSVQESLDYAPEFAPEVNIGVLAVHEELLRVFPGPETYRALWAAQCPVAVQSLEARLGDAAAAFVLVPLHPLNVARVQDWYAEEFQAGRMLILEGPAIASVPTLSLRTVVPRASVFDGLRMKLPVPVQATSLPRYVSPVEVRASTLMGHALRGLALPEELVWLPEDYAVHLRFIDGDSGTYENGRRIYSYEEARFCSCIFRTSPTHFARDGFQYVPLSALFARPGGDDGPTLWQDFWRSCAVDDGREWFRRYAATVIQVEVGVLIKYGVAFEAHQQNTILEIHDKDSEDHGDNGTQRGDLARLIVQELGGGVFWDPDRVEMLPIDFRSEVYKRDNVLEPYSKCLACVRHALFRSHLVPLAEEVSAFFKLPVDDLLADTADLIRTVHAKVAQCPTDRFPATEFANYAQGTVDKLLAPGKGKALLSMRLLQTKDEIYVNSPWELEPKDIGAALCPETATPCE